MKISKYLIPILCAGLMNCSGFKNLPSFQDVFSEKEKHAVIMSGDSDFRHPKSISLADSILSKNNYKTHIFDDTDNRNYKVTGITTKKNLENFFDTLKTDKNDLFLLYVTGHGNRDTTKKDTTSIIKMPDGKLLNPSTLEKYINKVSASEKVLLFTQCYGGGFRKKLRDKKNITISTSYENKSSYGTSFGEGFFNSFNNKEADTNKDNKISVLESSCYACEKDIHTPHRFDYRTELFGEEICGFLFNNNAKQVIKYNQPRINSGKLKPKEIYLSKVQ